jgi:hypothetical protein
MIKKLFSNRDPAESSGRTAIMVAELIYPPLNNQDYFFRPGPDQKERQKRVGGKARSLDS